MKIFYRYKFMTLGLLILIFGYVIIRAIPIHYHERKNVYLEINQVQHYATLASLFMAVNHAMEKQDPLANLADISIHIKYPYDKYFVSDISQLAYFTTKEHLSFFNNDWFVKQHGYLFYYKDGLLKGIHVSNRYSLPMSRPAGIPDEWLFQMDYLLFYFKSEYQSVIENVHCNPEDIHMSSNENGLHLWYFCDFAEKTIELEFVVDEHGNWRFR